jgi:hypothetical protein
MTQVFSRRAELGVKLVVLGVAGVAVAALATAAAALRGSLVIGEPMPQPIPFSHKHHVGDDGLDCRYCHTTVETQAFAGMPSTRTCLGCHSQLFAQASVLAPLHESAATRRPIAWNRVHFLPQFVYFDHSIHLAKGVGCVECHGRVDQMPLTWREAPLQMQWCLDCHRDPLPHLRAPADVFTLSAPRATPQEAARLAQALGLHDTRRLTDCSTCHR